MLLKHGTSVVLTFGVEMCDPDVEWVVSGNFKRVQLPNLPGVASPAYPQRGPATKGVKVSAYYRI